MPTHTAANACAGGVAGAGGGAGGIGGAGAAGDIGGGITGAGCGTAAGSDGVSGGASAPPNIWSYEGAVANASGTAEGAAGFRASGASAGAGCVNRASTGAGAGSTAPKAAPRPPYPSSSGGPNGFPLACFQVVIAATRTRGALWADGHGGRGSNVKKRFQSARKNELRV